MLLTKKSIAALALLSAGAFAHDELEMISVKGHHESDSPLSHIHKESVVKKEVLPQKRISHKNATNLARAIDMEPGVQTTLTCANCGSQRVTLNGLRGENTTVLIDGIPAFSSVSSFYGMEAIPLVGLDRVEIMRGAGSSLTAPEAIGGVVNLVTLTPDSKKFSYQVRGGEHEFFNQQFLGAYGTQNGGTLIAAQTNQMGSFDEDNNDVAESSRQLQKSLFFKQENRLGDKLKVSVRGGFQDLELIGGTTKVSRVRTAPNPTAEEGDFDRGDVRRQYTGPTSRIGDWIRLKRLDTGGSLTYHVNSDLNIKGAFSLAKQDQNAVYFHGYDYDNKDMFRFFDLKVNKVVSDKHFLTLGVDSRNEEMFSNSKVLYLENSFPRDSFEFDTLGAYIQDEWFITEKDELNLVLRVDRMKVNWLDKRLPNAELDKTAIAPRVHYKRIHSDQYSSRFSYGIGYRAPLTLFESQHGTNEEGFLLDINKLERAQTFTYTFNREEEKRSSAYSFTLTHLEHMAYGDETSEPMIFKNASEAMNIGTLNFLHVEKVTSQWTLEASFDWFMMPDSYKRKLPIAAQETRARLVSDYHFGKNEFVAFLNVVGPRNLKKYNYDRNYNVMTEDIFFNDVLSARKKQHAPMYATIDLFFNREITKNIDWTLGVTNLLDYTQTKSKESPLAWRVHGEHAHLDNRHIWGPTQGRVVYTGMKIEI